MYPTAKHQLTARESCSNQTYLQGLHRNSVEPLKKQGVGKSGTCNLPYWPVVQCIATATSLHTAPLA